MRQYKNRFWRASLFSACLAVTGIVLAGSGPAFARDTAMLNAAQLQQVVNDAHAKYKDLKDGKNADYIPILATITSELFGVAIALPDGTVFTAGDVDYRFAIESTSKPCTAALVMQQ